MVEKSRVSGSMDDNCTARNYEKKSEINKRSLYLTRDLHRAGPKVESMWHDGSKIMKYHVLSGYVDEILAEEFAVFKIKLSFLTDILSLALVKTIQENCFIVFTKMHHIYLT